MGSFYPNASLDLHEGEIFIAEVQYTTSSKETPLWLAAIAETYLPKVSELKDGYRLGLQ